MNENKIEKALIKVITKIIILLIYSYVFMIIWNYTIPELFGLVSINYTKAILLYMMINIGKTSN